MGRGFVATASVAIALALETDKLRTTVTVGRPTQADLKIPTVLFEKMFGGNGSERR
jgi:hypothetical protein